GLAISQRLANLMGGNILAESTPGEGSTFTLVLRATDAGSAPRPEDVDRHAAPTESQAPPPHRRPKPQPVPVVAFGDQEEALAELERQVRPGVRLTWTTRANEVMELAVREQAALVVLDISSAEGAAW